MGREEFIYREFLKNFKYEPSSCQDKLLREIASFLVCDDADILVVNGYAGTGKTSAVSAVIGALAEFEISSVLLAPTGRAAKVLSRYAGRPAYTVHKQIYRQKSVGEDGFGQFSLMPNKQQDTLFVVDEVSLIGIDTAEHQSSSLFGTGNLLEDLISYLRSGVDCKMILIGDAAQLPPVGLDAGPALSRDYMEGFGGVRFCELTEVVRQAAESGILHNATILRKMISDAPADDFLTGLKFRLRGFDDIERVSGSELIDKITEAYDKYGEDETIILCRSNKRAIRYNSGVRSMVQFKEDRLVRGDTLMIVRNCYQFCEDVKGLDYIANGDIVKLLKIGGFEERYGLHFADATILFPDYDDAQITAKVCLDTLESESASLTYEQQNTLYQGVNADYSNIRSKRKRWAAVREDIYFNALQLKYANAITCHKSQGGQWRCVFVDSPLWQDELTADDLKWLYTAITRGVEKVYLVNFKDGIFEK